MYNLLATTILLIGDSHTVGPFGKKLDQLLRAEGANVATYGSCGSIAGWWYSGQKTSCGYYKRGLDGVEFSTTNHFTPLFKNILSDVKPDAVIVELGTNYVMNPNDEFAIRDMKKMATDIRESGAECFWIMPPDMRKFRRDLPRLNRLVTEAVTDSCRLFESAQFTQYPAVGGDGIHYWSASGTPLAHKWAQDAATVFLNN